ncbi:MAG: TatD family hydrolase [Lentisphaeria bacterium]|nr:TatD family hydrolase [Lentisphaeria bacterium]
MMDYYDCHAHLADERLRGKLDFIVRECEGRSVRGVVVAAARHLDWSPVLQICTRPGFLAALGLHPFFLEDWTPSLPDELRTAVTSNSSVVAIGEIGLDFWHGREDESRQLEAFEQQLSIAAEQGLPGIFHNRKSWPDFFAVLRRTPSKAGGVCHHFTGSVEVACEALDHGLHLSFCGPITYANAHRIRAAAAFTPLDRLLVETDCPDLPAASHRGELSMPWQVSEVVEEIARAKTIPVREAAEAIQQNFQRLFDSVEHEEC